jgi:hypothetical protein
MFDVAGGADDGKTSHSDVATAIGRKQKGEDVGLPGFVGQ